MRIMRKEAMFQEEFMKLITRSDGTIKEMDLYDVLTALRGPDSFDAAVGMSTLKLHTTSRLRYIVFGGVDHGWATFNRYPLGGTDLEAVREAVRNIVHSAQVRYQRNTVSHFIIHTQEAIWATRRHPHWGGLAEDLYEALKELVV